MWNDLSIYPKVLKRLSDSLMGDLIENIIR